MIILILFADISTLHADFSTLHVNNSLCFGSKNREASPSDRNTLKLNTRGCM